MIPLQYSGSATGFNKGKRTEKMSTGSDNSSSWVGKKPLRRVGCMSDALSIASDLGFHISSPPQVSFPRELFLFLSAPLDLRNFCLPCQVVVQLFFFFI